MLPTLDSDLLATREGRGSLGYHNAGIEGEVVRMEHCSVSYVRKVSPSSVLRSECGRELGVSIAVGDSERGGSEPE
jgi:hypothetical protein